MAVSEASSRQTSPSIPGASAGHQSGPGLLAAGRGFHLSDFLAQKLRPVRGARGLSRLVQCHTFVTTPSSSRLSPCAIEFAVATILVVDDEPEAVELVEFNLKQAGYGFIAATNGAEALEKARALAPSLIVLDLMMPELDGLEVCKILRRDPVTASIPIIMLTAKASETDRVVGLELGADDYVTKPYSPRELLLRIKRLLQPGQNSQYKPERFQFGALVIDRSRHLVSWRGKPIVLTATELKLLATLAERRGRVQSREQLLRDVWGYKSAVDSRTVDTHMRRLRGKLGPAARYLDTVHGVGYRFAEEPT